MVLPSLEHNPDILDIFLRLLVLSLTSDELTDQDSAKAKALLNDIAKLSGSSWLSRRFGKAKDLRNKIKTDWENSMKCLIDCSERRKEGELQWNRYPSNAEGVE